MVDKLLDFLKSNLLYALYVNFWYVTSSNFISVDNGKDSSAELTSPTGETVIARFNFPWSPPEEISSLLTSQSFLDTSCSGSLQQEFPQPTPSTEIRQLGSPQRRSRRRVGKHNILVKDTLLAEEEYPLISSANIHLSEGVQSQYRKPSPERLSSRRTLPARSRAHRLRSPLTPPCKQTVSHQRGSLPTRLKTPLSKELTFTNQPTVPISSQPAPTMSPTKLITSSHFISSSSNSATPFIEEEMGSDSFELSRRSLPLATPSPPRIITVPERRISHRSKLSLFGEEDKEPPQEQAEISWFHQLPSLTSSSFSPMPQQERQQQIKKTQLKLIQSPRRQSKRSRTDYSRLLEDTVLAKESSDDGSAYTIEPPTSRTDIDPFVVGPLIVQMALRENQQLDDELKENAKSMYWVERQDKPCPCDVRHHPSWWSLETIENVHRYSFLLDCRDLNIKTERVIAGNSRKTVLVYDVPMENRNPWKTKAEQVLRYVDVETGVGDQTAYNVHYYIQPSDRKIFLVLSSHRVVGLVVAEPQATANRVLHETQQYRDLEEQAVPVRVGINRLWVHVSMRRIHLATLLCQLVRQLFYEGEKLKMEDIAFNNISDAGVAFAKIYLKTYRVPLYDGKTGILL